MVFLIPDLTWTVWLWPSIRKMLQDHQTVVRLNVGGTYHTTSKTTLTRYPDSQLGAMFSRSVPPTLDETGAIFIDRDGHLFQYVLNFLRSPKLPLITDTKLLDQLIIEAEFYQLDALIKALESMKYHVEAADRALRQKGYLLEIMEIRTGPADEILTDGFVKTLITGSRKALDLIPTEFKCDYQFYEQPVLDRGVDYMRDEVMMCTTVKRPNPDVFQSRFELAEYLQNTGWLLVNNNFSTSALSGSEFMNCTGYNPREGEDDGTNKPGAKMLIQQSYRERWLLPEYKIEQWILA